jgi:hypothetical protein
MSYNIPYTETILNNALEIIDQGGHCINIKCPDCPIFNPNIDGCGLLPDRNITEQCKQSVIIADEYIVQYKLVKFLEDE